MPFSDEDLKVPLTLFEKIIIVGGIIILLPFVLLFIGFILA